MTDKEFLKQLGLRLKCQRIMVELTTKQVAEKTGICQATIQSIEKGSSDFHMLNLRKLSIVYGVEMKDVM